MADTKPQSPADDEVVLTEDDVEFGELLDGGAQVDGGSA